eukprot:scaffold122468_cov63-Phaeocystis_antarctica.AAC.1
MLLRATAADRRQPSGRHPSTVRPREVAARDPPNAAVPIAARHEQQPAPAHAAAATRLDGAAGHAAQRPGVARLGVDEPGVDERARLARHGAAAAEVRHVVPGRRGAHVAAAAAAVRRDALRRRAAAQAEAEEPRARERGARARRASLGARPVGDQPRAGPAAGRRRAAAPAQTAPGDARARGGGRGQPAERAARPHGGCAAAAAARHRVLYALAAYRRARRGAQGGEPAAGEARERGAGARPKPPPRC